MVLVERSSRSSGSFLDVQPVLDKVQPFLDFATASIFEADVTDARAQIDTSRFIPVARRTLLSRLETLLARHPDGAAIIAAVRALVIRRHLDHRERLHDVLDGFLPFCPDNEMVTVRFPDAETERDAQKGLVASLEELLDRANFSRIDEATLNALLAEKSPYGLHLSVDLDDFDEALVFARGTTTAEESFRDPWRLYLTTHRYTAQRFQRLFVMLKVRPFADAVRHVTETRGISQDRAERVVRARRQRMEGNVSEHSIYIKLFKDLPQADLEMVFPNIRIGFRPFDKLRISLLAGGGTIAGGVTTATKVLAAASPLALTGAILAFGFIVFRQLKTILATRTEYMMMLAQKLFFHTLASNRGAITLLADGAEEEDAKECALLYAFMAMDGGRLSDTEDTRRRIGDWLKAAFDVEVRFDIGDALSRLIADGAVRPDGDGWTLLSGPPRADAA